MVHYADAAVSSHESAGGVCVRTRVVCLSRFSSGFYIHLSTFRANVYVACVYVCVVAALFLLLPHQNSLGETGRHMKYLTIVSLKEQQMLCSAN